MLSGFLEKAITATISLGMMVFSSYQGNTPSFIEHGATHRGNRITVQATLDNAFNDEDIIYILENFNGIVIIDEAYIDFGAETAISLISEYNNLLVTRNFNWIKSIDKLIRTPEKEFILVGAAATLFYYNQKFN